MGGQIDSNSASGGGGRAAGLMLVALGLAVLLILVLLMRQMGVPETVLAPALLVLPLAAMAAAALVTPVRGGVGYHRGGGAQGGAAGGLAAAAAVAMLPAFASPGGPAFESGYDGLWGGLGLALGFVLFAVGIAPAIGRARTTDLAEAVGARTGGALRVAIALIVLVLMTAALAAGLGGLAATLQFAAGLAPEVALGSGALLVLLVVLPGGLRSASAAQAVAGIVLIAAVVVLAGAWSWQRYGSPQPVLAYGDTLTEVGRLEIALIGQKLADGASLKRHAAPYITTDALNFLGAVATTALGLAALPFLSARAAAAPSLQSARGVTAGGLLALLPVIVLMPALAVFLRYDLLSLIAKPVQLSALPAWVYELGQAGALQICNAPASTADAVVSACAAVSGHKGMLRLQDVRVEPALAFLSVARVSGMSPVFACLAAAGAIAALAAMSAAAALAGAEALARGLVPAELTASRAAASRVAVVLLVGAAGLLVQLWPQEVRALAAWILPVAASALLPALVLGLNWRRASSGGLLAGVVAGLAVTLYYLVATRYFPLAFFERWPQLSNAPASAARKLEMLRTVLEGAPAGDRAVAFAAVEAQAATLANWFGIRPVAAGLIGVPAGFAVAVMASLAIPRRAKSGPPAGS